MNMGSANINTADLDDVEKCSNCGSKLASDSLFCHICGAKNTNANNKGEEAL